MTRPTLLIVAHGSRRQASNEEVRALARRLAAAQHPDIGEIEVAFLELAEPSIADGLTNCVNKGAKEIAVFPYFLAAGTHVAEGQAMSARTRQALESIPELGEHRYGRHRSHQIDAADLAWAEVILAAELDHVRYVERLAGDRSRAVQLGAFAAYALSGRGLEEQLREVRRYPADASRDVRDPAGGEQADYDACARELWRLAKGFVARMT